MQQQDRAPNWNKWRHVPHVRLWEAVALSLNIDPDRVRQHSDSWMLDHRLFKEDSEFQDRVFVAERNLGRGLNPKIISMGNPEDCSVEISQFVDWAMSLPWVMPEELTALAGARKKSVPTTEPDNRVLEGKARTSALKLILGMALDSYGFDPKAARSLTAKQISDDLFAYGISISDDTVREWLQTAADEIDWHPKDRS